MEYSYCPNCKKNTGRKRALGWGTFFGVLITFGLWILATPFYPKRCIICGYSDEIPSEEDTKSQPKKWYKTWLGILLIIIGIFWAIGLIGKLLSNSHRGKPSESITSQSTPSFTSDTLKAADQGELIFEKITKEYPSINLEPVIFGWLTPNPYLLLTIPEKEWFNLSKKDQINLTYYLEVRMLPVARALPEKFIPVPDATRTAPIYKFHIKNLKLCQSCWAISTGRIAPSKNDIYLDKTVVQGDSIWEKEGSGVRASEFRKNLMGEKGSAK